MTIYGANIAEPINFMRERNRRRRESEKVKALVGQAEAKRMQDALRAFKKCEEAEGKI